jgi:hypothetical protein
MTVIYALQATDGGLKVAVDEHLTVSVQDQNGKEIERVRFFGSNAETEAIQFAQDVVV